MGLWSWAKTAAQNALKGQINFQEGQAPGTLNDSARALMADVAKFRDDISGALTTTGSAGVYSVTTSSQITDLVAGLRLLIKANHASLGASTLNVDGLGGKKIRIVDDSGERDLKENEWDANGFYSVAYDPSADGGAGGWVSVGATVESLDTSNFGLKDEGVATIASAVTCDIGALTEYRVKVTGTTAITSFGTGANKRKLLRFTDALTLTHNATSLILPGGADITTAAGDVFEFASDASGNWRCIGAQLASGKSIVATDTSSLEAQVNEIERVSKNKVQNHFTTAVRYSSGTEPELLGLATTINNVKAGNDVKITASISMETNNNTMMVVKRNGVEIGSAPDRGSRIHGLCPVDHDSNTDSTMSPITFTYVDDSPDEGTNVYTFFNRQSSSYHVNVNRTHGDSDSSTYECAASTIVLEEIAR